MTRSAIFHGFDEDDMEAAIAASLVESSSPARQPSDRKVGKSKSHDAEVSTPAEARARRKRNGKEKMKGCVRLSSPFEPSRSYDMCVVDGVLYSCEVQWSRDRCVPGC